MGGGGHTLAAKFKHLDINCFTFIPSSKSPPKPEDYNKTVAYYYDISNHEKPWNSVKSIRDDISRKCHVNVGDSLGSIRTLTVTPCIEVVAVWTVPGAVSPG